VIHDVATIHNEYDEQLLEHDNKDKGSSVEIVVEPVKEIIIPEPSSQDVDEFKSIEIFGGKHVLNDELFDTETEVNEDIKNIGKVKTVEIENEFF
jgi:hypothetical protein